MTKIRMNGELSQPNRKLRGFHRKGAARRGTHETPATPAAIRLSVPNTVRTAKNIRTKKYRYAGIATAATRGRGKIHPATTIGTLTPTHAIAAQVRSGE